LLEHANEYKTLSYGILSECFNEDSNKTSKLLRRKLKHWGNQTCLEIAVDVKEMVCTSQFCTHTHFRHTPALKLLLMWKKWYALGSFAHTHALLLWNHFNRRGRCNLAM